jgi:transposase-like protein
MSTPNTYTEAFREQALKKVYCRGQRTISDVADELNISFGTLNGWMRKHKKQSHSTTPVASKRPNDWTAAERLNVLMESHGLADEALNAFCRKKGIFAHHIEEWKKAFETDATQIQSNSTSTLRELKTENQSLNKELKRKEKALAEAAALLVLQKKFQAFWADKES